PVRQIWGVGPRLAARLEADGLRTHGDLAAADRTDLMARYGSMGLRLARLARGEDSRAVVADGAVKSISAETTFDEDTANRETLEGHLWRLAVRASDRAKAKRIAGSVVTLKLKTARFRPLSRQTALETPSSAAETLYRAGAMLLGRCLDQGPFRLIGIGFSRLEPAGDATLRGGLGLDAEAAALKAEAATDKIRDRFGGDAIMRGRSLR
ncbi:MAG: DNA polymerase IV, partial [Pseudomonadota bacterium]